MSNTATLQTEPTYPSLVPPRPPMAAENATLVQRMVAFRKNALTVWGPRAYQEDVLVGNFLGKRNLVLNSPANIRRVLVENYENYFHTSVSLRVLRPMLGDGLLTSYGSTWKHKRRTLAPAFAPRAVLALLPHMLSAMDDTLEQMDRRCETPIDLRAMIQRMTLDIAGRTMFSLEMQQHGAELRGFVTEYMARYAHPQFLDMLFPLWLSTPTDIKRSAFRRRWLRFVSQLIKERRNAPQSGEGTRAEQPARDLFDLMVAARDPENDRRFSDNELIDEVATMILPGHETTATALFWSLYLISQDTRTQEELADSVRGMTIDDTTDISRLTYVRAVINEAIRLYPPVFLVSRAAIAADTVAGIPVRPKDMVTISPWLLHRHDKLWDDPHAFRPQRFLPGAPTPDRFAYMPFGAGPRVCIGAHFATLVTTLALAKLIQRFRVSLLSTRPAIPVGAITTQPDHSPTFRLTLR